MLDGVIWTSQSSSQKVQSFRSANCTWGVTVLDNKYKNNFKLVVTFRRMCKRNEVPLRLGCYVMWKFWISRENNCIVLTVWIMHFEWPCHWHDAYICNGPTDPVFVSTSKTSLMDTLSSSKLFSELQLYFPQDSSLSNLKSSPEISCYCITIIEWSLPFFFNFPLPHRLQVTKVLLSNSSSTMPTTWHKHNMNIHASQNSIKCSGGEKSSVKTGIQRTDIICCNVESIENDFTKTSKPQSPFISLPPTLQRYDIALIVILNILISNCVLIGAHARVPNMNLNEPSSNESIHNLLTSLICDQIPTNILFSQDEIQSCHQSRCYLSSESPCCSHPHKNNLTNLCHAEGCNLTHSQTCCEAIERVSNADNQASQYARMFSETMSKYTTPETYSRRWSLDHCITAYKNWICSLEHRFFNDSSQEQASCISASLCSCVEKSCPFFRVHNETKLYGGQPCFLCQARLPVVMPNCTNPMTDACCGWLPCASCFQEVSSVDQRICLKYSIEDKCER